MKITFWLLDLNYAVENDAPEVWIWGVAASGERVVIVDKSLIAYFYAVIEETADPEAVVEAIGSKRFSNISKLEVVDRKFFGKSLKAVKVYCTTPEMMSEYAKALRKLEGVKDCLEDDIRFAMRYLVDNNVVPCSWHEVEVAEQNPRNDVCVDKMYLAKSVPKPIEKAEAPALRVLGFSSIYYSKEGSPKPDRNPVVIISTTTNKGEKKQFVADDDRKDMPILNAFVAYVQGFDPDIVVGYGNNNLDWS